MHANATDHKPRPVAGRCLVVHGDADPLYPVVSAMELNTGLPDAQLWILPGGGHCPIFGDQAQPFAELALRFLTSDGAA
ncbi:alpha/beta fold hydrolase [Dinoroseobacter sp. S124A]|uniref:alpha/beta fold hydrolase n=1 Tax=Dinoroseobacter sp. S124A TaxID=3415128 RepID=UPI003C79835B